MKGLNSFSTGKANERNASTHYGHYLRSRNTSLWDVYGRFSQAKRNAFDYCVDLMNELNGCDLRIISYNSQAFTVGFLFNHPETGRECFAYITKDYNRFCEV